MSQRQKRLEKWLNNPPKDAPIEEVDGILKYYFPDQTKDKKRGSHTVRIKHDALKKHPNYGPDGGFDIPIKGGQKVKGKYLKLLAQAIELLSELEHLKK